MKYKPSKETLKIMLLSLLPLIAGIFNYYAAGWFITQNPTLTAPRNQALYEKYFFFSIIASSLYLMPLLSSFGIQCAIAQLRKDHRIHPDSYSEDEKIYHFLPIALFFVFILCIGLPTQFQPMFGIQKEIESLWRLIHGREISFGFIYVAFLFGKGIGFLHTRRQFRRYPYETEPIKYAPVRSELYTAPKQPKQTREKLLALWMGVSLIACIFFLYTDNLYRWPFWIWLTSLVTSIFFLVKAITSPVKI